MPNELSGGMRKRAGFARALVLDPDIVLFDEPDSGLDPVRTALLCELIQEIHEENGGAYVVITHDIMSARRVAEYIAVLWKGRIVESGPGRGAVQLRQRRSCASSSPASRRARWAWSSAYTPMAHAPARSLSSPVRAQPAIRCGRAARDRGPRRRRSARSSLAVAVVAVHRSCAATAGRTYKLRFQNAGQLVKDDDVQVGGRRDRLGRDDRADRRQPGRDHDRGRRTSYAPLHEGTTAIIRATSLSGIANRYVALTPGPELQPQARRRRARWAPTRTTSIVDLDQLFNTLDPETRAALQSVIQGSATLVRRPRRAGQRGGASTSTRR